MTDIGPVNPKEYQYYTHVPGGDSFSLDYITDTVFNAVTANSVNAISSLTAESILREHLTDAFDLTNASIKYETAKSKYDGIGRLYFEAPVEVTGFNTSFDKANNNIEVKGFDYSANNVSEYNSTGDNSKGKKLIVTISGVIADRNSEIELDNTSINDTTLTALYENSRREGLGAEVKRRILFGTYVLSVGNREDYYLRACDVREKIKRRMAEQFETCDLLILPTAPTTAFCLGEYRTPKQMYEADLCTVYASLAGYPAISVPFGKDGNGLPLAVQLIAPPMCEERLLATAKALEEGMA